MGRADAMPLTFSRVQKVTNNNITMTNVTDLQAIVEAIDTYPNQCRLAYYLTLEIVNINLARSFPYEDFIPYKDDIETLGEKIMKGARIEAIEPYANLLSMDMRSLLKLVGATINDAISSKSMNTMEHTLGCINMLYAMNSILEEFHTMKVAEIEKAVKNHKIKNGLLYFKDLEAIAEKVTRQIINGMMKMKES